MPSYNLFHNVDKWPPDFTAGFIHPKQVKINVKVPVWKYRDFWYLV